MSEAQASAPALTVGPLPGSRKVYVPGHLHPELRVPLREIMLDASSGEPPLHRRLGLTDEGMDGRGLHPEFGEVTVRQVLSTWVAHDLTHLSQIGEVLARRYREDVGPYRAYLPALDRVAEAE